MISAQTRANEQSQLRNALAGQRTGPFGGITATQDPQGRVTGQTRTLAQPLQSAADIATGNLATNVGFLPTDRFTMSDVPRGIDLARNFFSQQANLLEDPFRQQREEQDVRLTNRGLPIGSEARLRDEENLRRQQALALQNAAFGAVQLTPAEQDRQLRNALTIREQGARDVSNLLGTIGGIGGLAPQFTAQPTFAPVNAANLTQQAFENELAQENAQRAQIASLAGAVGQLGGTILGGPIGGALAGSLFGAGRRTPQVSGTVQRGPSTFAPQRFQGTGFEFANPIA